MKKTLLITFSLIALGANAQKPSGSFVEFEFTNGSKLNTSANTTVTGFTGTIQSSKDRRNTANRACKKGGTGISGELGGVSIAGSGNYESTTTSFWVKLTDSLDIRTVLKIRGNRSAGFEIGYGADQIELRAKVASPASSTNLVLTDNVGGYDTNWHHIVLVTKNGRFASDLSLKLYFDTVLKFDTLLSHNTTIYSFIDAADLTVYPYYNTISNRNTYTEQIDDIYFYKSTLTYAKVKQLYHYYPTSSVSIHEVENNGEVSVFPNPATDRVTFKTKENIKTIEIYTISGQKAIVSNTTKTIDISNLKKGVYTAKLVLENGNILFKKIIKQ